MNTENWKKDYEEFEKVTRQFYAGEVSVPEYKGFSGGFGSYAQRGGKAFEARRAADVAAALRQGNDSEVAARKLRRQNPPARAG